MKMIFIKILLIMITISIVDAQVHVFECVKVGQKGIFRQYKEVFDGEKVIFVFDRDEKKDSFSGVENSRIYTKMKNIDFNYGDIKFHTADSKVVYANNLGWKSTEGDIYVSVKIKLNFIDIGFFYDKKGYYNCIREDDPTKRENLVDRIGLGNNKLSFSDLFTELQ